MFAEEWIFLMNLIFLEPDELELWKPTEQKTFKLSLV
jgi:hypothetical protein